MSLLRVINTPRRGIGKSTLDALVNAAQQLSMPLWEIISDRDSVNTLAGRAAKSVNQFAAMIKSWQDRIETASAFEILQGILKDSSYIQDYQNQGTDEAENRLENLEELSNAVSQFQEDYEDTTLQGFLASAALASDLDDLKEGQKRNFPDDSALSQRAGISRGVFGGSGTGTLPQFPQFR